MSKICLACDINEDDDNSLLADLNKNDIPLWSKKEGMYSLLPKLVEKKKFIKVLQFLIYFVDTLRANNIVWGVGRGSSVASLCLFLIGVHKINPLQYNLDITEFLR